jgi:hypothetical protein
MCRASQNCLVAARLIVGHVRGNKRARAGAAPMPTPLALGVRGADGILRAGQFCRTTATGYDREQGAGSPGQAFIASGDNRHTCCRHRRRVNDRTSDLDDKSLGGYA